MTAPRAAVIGYGYAGRSFHSYLIDSTPGLTLHGVASGSVEKRAQIEQEQGCKAYHSFDKVIAVATAEEATKATSAIPVALALLHFVPAMTYGGWQSYTHLRAHLSVPVMALSGLAAEQFTTANDSNARGKTHVEKRTANGQRTFKTILIVLSSCSRPRKANGL